MLEELNVSSYRYNLACFEKLVEWKLFLGVFLYNELAKHCKAE